MDVELTALLVEDTEIDASLIVGELQRAGFTMTWERVDALEDLRAALQRRPWDLVISGASLAKLDLLHALDATRAAAPGTPFIVVSGSPLASTALQAMRAGASDAISKDKIGRLGPAVARALHRTSAVGSIAHLLLAAQELERRRIARALHDELGQHLVALRLLLESPHDSAAAIAMLDEALAQTRDFALELWPTVLDDLGLGPALRWLASRHARSDLAFRVVVEAVPRVPPALETAGFRIAQEAITNIERHAGASVVELALRRVADDVELEIRDDGVGFDAERAWRHARGTSVGLFAMRERAELAGGRLEIIAAPGCGTIVRVRFPFRDAR